MGATHRDPGHGLGEIDDDHPRLLGVELDACRCRFSTAHASAHQDHGETVVLTTRSTVDVPRAAEACHRHDGVMDAAVTPLLDALDDGRDRAASEAPALLARVVSLRGFGLRDAGDGAVIVDGAVRGSILGGLTDDALLAEARAGDGRRAFRTTITDRAADAAGMVCGGVATLLLTPVSDLPRELVEVLRSAQPVALAARSDGSGGDLVVTGRERFGSLGPDTDAAIDAARNELDGGATSTTEHELPNGSIVVSTVVPRTRCMVVGSGPMAEAIKAQGELLGWRVTIDESVELATDFLESAGPADAIAVLSHDPSVDVPLLDAALRSSIGYIGGMGSRGTQTRRRTSLGERGHDETTLGRIHGPIGLDLGARTPAETSVSIVAEYLAHRSGRTPGRLSDGAGPING